MNEANKMNIHNLRFNKSVSPTKCARSKANWRPYKKHAYKMHGNEDDDVDKGERKQDEYNY